MHPDLLVAKPGWKRFRVADVKSYLDLDGRTDPTEIATAVRQIAVGIVALRRDHGEDAADELVDIVLRTPRRPGAGVRTLDASVEIATITSWLASSGAIVTEALVENGGKPLDTRAGVESIAHHWDASCEGHCPMSEVCHAEATARGDLMLLGPTVEVALEGVASISRATVLATGGAPVTVDEKRVAANLAAGWAASEAAESLELSPGSANVNVALFRHRGDSGRVPHRTTWPTLEPANLGLTKGAGRALPSSRSSHR